MRRRTSIGSHVRVRGSRSTTPAARCALRRARRCMTGKHTGHGAIRGNGSPEAGDVPLPAAEVTISRSAENRGIPHGDHREVGSRTARQRQARPTNRGSTTLSASSISDTPIASSRIISGATARSVPTDLEHDYVNDLFTREAAAIRRTRRLAAVLRLPELHRAACRAAGPGGVDGAVPREVSKNVRSRIRPPTHSRPGHVPEGPSLGYRSQPAPFAAFAGMITRMDRDVGRLADLVHARGLDERTLILFISDNGPHKEGGADPAYFNSSGGLRGIKRDLYEGGIRVPMIARWPGTIPAGRVSDQVVGALGHAADAGGAGRCARRPSGLDGMSMANPLCGKAARGACSVLLGVPRSRLSAGGADGPMEGSPPRSRRRRWNFTISSRCARGARRRRFARRHRCSHGTAISSTARTESERWPAEVTSVGGSQSARVTDCQGARAKVPAEVELVASAFRRKSKCRTAEVQSTRDGAAGRWNWRREADSIILNRWHTASRSASRRSSRSSIPRPGSCARTCPSCWRRARRRSASRSSARCTSRSSRSAPGSATNVPELREEIFRIRRELAGGAERVGLAVAAAGTHPFSHWKDQILSPGVRYDSIVEELQQLARSLLIFGLHVHVAVPDGQTTIDLMNAGAVLPAAPARAVDELAVLDGARHRPEVVPHDDLPALSRAPACPITSSSWSEYENYVKLLVELHCIDDAQEDLVGRAAASDVRHAGVPRLRRADAARKRR